MPSLRIDTTPATAGEVWMTVFLKGLTPSFPRMAKHDGSSTTPRSTWRSPMTVMMVRHHEPRNFRTAVQYRLGIPVVDPDSICPMCMQPIDIFGDHAVCCTKARDLIVRHNSVRNLVDSIASDGLLSSVM